MATDVIAGVEIDVGPDAVWVRSAAPLRTLASAVVGGDLDAARHVVNMHVPRGYASGDPAAGPPCLRAAPRYRGAVRRADDGGLTHEARIVCEEADGVRVLVVATVGLGDAGRGRASRRPSAWQPSTINVVGRRSTPVWSGRPRSTA